MVDLLEYAVQHQETIDLLSDQTSCHVVYDGGYCPQGLTFQERTELIKTDHARFVEHVDASLKHHFDLIRQLVDRGTYFFDYGNSFLKAIADAGVTRVCRNGRNTLDGFIYPSYVEDLMGPLALRLRVRPPFDGSVSAANRRIWRQRTGPPWTASTPNGGFRIGTTTTGSRDAGQNQLVVGTQARILYQDAEGRTQIALKFNEMVPQRDDRRRSCWDATITTPAVPTRPTARPPISMTGAMSWPTWPPIALPATRPAA